MFAGHVRDGSQAALGGELLGGGEARAVVPELGEDLRGVDGAAARQALHQRPVGMLGQRRRDGRGELLEVRPERGEDGDERADDVAAGLGFCRADLARGGRAEAGEQVGRRPPATVGVLAEELGEAFFTQARGAVGGGIATEEGQGDGRVDVGEDGGGPGPEPLEQGAELIGEGDALGDEIVPTAYEGAQGTRVVRGRPPRPEAMAIGPQQIGEDERIAGVTLAAGGGVAWAAGLERVGVDRYDLHPGLDEGIDEQAGGAFERDPKGAAVEQAPQAAEQLREPLGGVGDGALPLDAARVVKDADRVGLTRPVDPDHEHRPRPGPRRMPRPTCARAVPAWW